VIYPEPRLTKVGHGALSELLRVEVELIIPLELIEVGTADDGSQEETYNQKMSVHQWCLSNL
jgi:hypothetical protein